VRERVTTYAAVRSIRDVGGPMPPTKPADEIVNERLATEANAAGSSSAEQ